jgi:hypothetical protein
MLKGQCHEKEIFLKVENILIITFCVCADGFQGLSKAFPYPIINFLFASLKLLILKMLTLTDTLLKIHFSVIGRCSLVSTSHWLQGKCAKISLSLAASSMILQNQRRLPVSIFNLNIAAVGSLMRFTGKIFKISK